MNTEIKKGNDTMDFYRITCSTYYNKECLYTHSAAIALLDEEPKNETMSFSWEDSEKFFQTYGFAFPAHLYRHKKGMYLDLYNIGFFGRKVKTWKEPNPNIKVTVEYEKYYPSIQRVLDWHDGTEAIAYLNEKGLKIN